ncbi:hypothetical protein SAMN04488076_104173 [Trichococcus palustris]|nr:hypothetical protein SAMN04488076_104173 [Trichococcus palustris]
MDSCTEILHVKFKSSFVTLLTLCLRYCVSPSFALIESKLPAHLVRSFFVQFSKGNLAYHLLRDSLFILSRLQYLVNNFEKNKFQKRFFKFEAATFI